MESLEPFSFLLGAALSALLAMTAFLFLRSRSVSRRDWESLQQQKGASELEARVLGERYESLSRTHEALLQRQDLREAEYKDMISRTANLETLLEGARRQLQDLQEKQQRDELLNQDQQAEIIALRHSRAESMLQLNHLQENYASQKSLNEQQNARISDMNEKILSMGSDLSHLNAQNVSLREKLETQKAEIEEFRKTSQVEFENIANRVLRAKSEEFTLTNKSHIEAILNPLKEDIGTFKSRVEETYDKESKQRFSLEEKVKELIEQTNKVSAEANNLASALKGQVKKQGNWGEMILESILEKSGLVKDREYFIQQTIQDNEGKNVRPDVLIKLPENRTIIIDSKVSLLAYDRYAAAENKEAQDLALAEHLRSCYKHIDDLSGRQYDAMPESLDFVMMFVPIEPAYLLAIQSDPDLWSYAYAKRILLISPTNLIAALKLVAEIWKRDVQSRNAQEIAKQGEKLYEKFVGFVENMEDIGKHILKTQETFTAAFKQLKDGRGNLIGQALKLKELGVKSSKQIPPALIPPGVDEDAEEPPSL